MTFGSRVSGELVKPLQGSEALQDLIDILKQNYLSDCPHCAGSGIGLRHNVCRTCKGSGRR